MQLNEVLILHVQDDRQLFYLLVVRVGTIAFQVSNSSFSFSSFCPSMATKLCLYCGSDQCVFGHREMNHQNCTNALFTSYLASQTKLCLYCGSGHAVCMGDEPSKLHIQHHIQLAGLGQQVTVFKILWFQFQFITKGRCYQNCGQLLVYSTMIVAMQEQYQVEL